MTYSIYKDPSSDLLQAKNFRRYVSDPNVLTAELENLLLQRLEKSAFIVAIDEVQKIPAVLDEVQYLLEKYKNKIFFILTGSSARKLKRGGANLLAGRAHQYELFPLSSIETAIDINAALTIGTLPKVHTQPETAIDTLEAYLGTYLREEIIEESLVRGVDRFSRFLELAAQLNGQPINFTKLGKSLKTSGQTVQEYFSILVDTLIAIRIDGWASSVKRQLMQAPKFYLFDCGILNTLTGELRTELLPSSYRYGKLFETWVFLETLRYNSYQRLGLRFFYWRDKDGHEIDMIIARSSAKPLVAVEIKSTTQPLEEDLKNLHLIRADYPKISLWCLCQTPRAYSIGNIEILPWMEGLKRLAAL